MSSLKKSAVVLFGVGALVANTAVGCSSDSDGGGFTVEDDAGGHAVLPDTGTLGDATPADDSSTEGGAIDSGDDDGSTDSGLDAAKDAKGDADASLDAGLDSGATGSACLPNGSIGTEPCGLCGFHTRLCAPNTAGGTPVWQVWGFCQDEVVDACVPGTMTTEACGNCGTRQKACQMDCSYAVGACTGQPVNSCPPGAIDFEDGLSCAVGGRQRTCSNTCTYGAFGGCITHGAAGKLTIPATAGSTTSGEFTLALSQTTKRLDTGDCPTTVTATSTAYQYIELDNPTAKTITVSVWSGKSAHAGSVVIDTIMGSYAGATVPSTDAARRACVNTVNDTCFATDYPTECANSWAGLVDTDALTIGPNGKALVYVASYFDTDKGDFKLTAHADTVTP